MSKMKMMTKCHSKIGIDVGAKGCLAHISNDEIINILRFDKVELKGYIDYLKSLDYPVDIYIESVHSMPGQGVRSMFSFGTRFGEILGMLGTMSLGYSLVPSNYWQKSVINKFKNFHYYSFKTNHSHSQPKEQTKEIIANIVKNKYPKFQSMYTKPKTGSLNYDITDSIGIAMYGLITVQ